MSDESNKSIHENIVNVTRIENEMDEESRKIREVIKKNENELKKLNEKLDILMDKFDNKEIKLKIVKE